MTVAAETAELRWSWLRSREFDLRFIVGVAGLALVCGLVAAQDARWFRLLLFGNLWLLGYHHVVSTYTRLCFDRASFREHRFLVLGLPFVVLAAAGGSAWGLGLWVLPTTYLYWQWFHYTRQSWGIAQVYRRKAGVEQEEGRFTRVAFYAVPLWGILHRSYQDPGSFLGTELRVLPVPGLLVDAVGVAALAALALWALTRWQLWRRGELPVAPTLYHLSHHLVFFTGYLWIGDLDAGWLVLNVWHNAQYILFVWLFNANRFRSGVDASAPFLSKLSQEGNAWQYFAVCLTLSTALYLALGHVAAAVPIAMVLYQAINFHHYLVDGLIWKVRRPALRRTLGIRDA